MTSGFLPPFFPEAWPFLDQDQCCCAAVIALANLLLAVVMLIVAQRSKPGREMELASEVRDSALPASEMDAQVLQQQLAEFRDGVRGVREAVVGFVRHPLATVQRSTGSCRAARRRGDQWIEEAGVNQFTDLRL
jgi:hypothetical protein